MVDSSYFQKLSPDTTPCIHSRKLTIELQNRTQREITLKISTI